MSEETPETRSFDLTPEEYLKLVQPFFPNEWGMIYPKDVTIEHITIGYCNSITVIRRNQDVIPEVSKEPSSLLIKRKGGRILTLEYDNPSTLAVVAYEMSKRSIGPKLYGLFKGGSVEEFIDSHMLTNVECLDPDIYRDIAISFANVHSIKGMPIAVNASIGINWWVKENMKKIPDKRDLWYNHESIKKFNLDLDYMFGFDFIREFDHLIKILDQVKMRKCFILQDRNRNNCLVRNQVEPGQSRIVQIDYDGCIYLYRGIDIGSYFLYQTFADDQEKGFIPLNDPQYYDIELKRKFLKIYQDEIKRLNIWNDFDEDEIDSIDNLLLESNIGTCYTILLIVSYIIVHGESVLEHDSRFASTLPYMLKQYESIKKEISNQIREQE